MGRPVGLYEYLAVEVHGRADAATALTASAETYDDDNGLALIDASDIAQTTLAAHDESDGVRGVDSIGFAGEGTIITHADSDTHDDGLGVLDLGSFGDYGTMDTRTEGETYDDAGIEGLGDLGPYAESTLLTKVDAETYDDDPGLGGFSAP